MAPLKFPKFRRLSGLVELLLLYFDGVVATETSLQEISHPSSVTVKLIFSFPLSVPAWPTRITSRSRPSAVVPLALSQLT